MEISYASQIREFTHKFMERYPDIELDFEVVAENTPPSLCARCDLVFTPCEYAQPPAGVVRRLIFSHGTYAAVSYTHLSVAQRLHELNRLFVWHKPVVCTCLLYTSNGQGYSIHVSAEDCYVRTDRHGQCLDTCHGDVYIRCGMRTGKALAAAYIHPVSYTHLDVYKRQA